MLSERAQENVILPLTICEAVSCSALKRNKTKDYVAFCVTLNNGSVFAGLNNLQTHF